MIEDLQLADFANHPPNVTAEVVCNGTAAFPYTTVTLDTLKSSRRCSR